MHAERRGAELILSSAFIRVHLRLIISLPLSLHSIEIRSRTNSTRRAANVPLRNRTYRAEQQVEVAEAGTASRALLVVFHA